MITKARLLNDTLLRWRQAGQIDWRARSDEPDSQYLLIRAVNERAALVIAPSSAVRCDDMTLACLTLEAYRLARPFDSDDEAAMVYPTSGDQAMLYRDIPVNKFGGLSFTADLEVAHCLDDFVREVKEVLGGSRESLWTCGSDVYGLPAVEDIVAMIKMGRYSKNMIRMLDRFPESEQARSVLRELTTSVNHGDAITAMSVLKSLGEAIDVSNIYRIASDLTNRPAASSASRMLAHAVADGNTAALDALFALSRNGTWLAELEPRWARGSMTTKEELYLAVCCEYPRRSRS